MRAGTLHGRDAYLSSKEGMLLTLVICILRIWGTFELFASTEISTGSSFQLVLIALPVRLPSALQGGLIITYYTPPSDDCLSSGLVIFLG